MDATVVVILIFLLAGVLIGLGLGLLAPVQAGRAGAR